MANPRALESLIARLGALQPAMPAPNRWWMQPDKFPGPQKSLELAIARNGLDRNSMTSGAFIDPRTGEVMDGRVFSGGVVMVRPDNGRPALAVGDPSDALGHGPISDANMVRRSVGWKPVSGDIDLPFLATVESGGRHFYGLGIDYQAPVMLRNTGGTSNPTLRPRSRGNIFADEPIGAMMLKGREHPVYEVLRVAPSGGGALGNLLR